MYLSSHGAKPLTTKIKKRTSFSIFPIWFSQAKCHMTEKINIVMILFFLLFIPPRMNNILKQGWFGQIKKLLKHK